MLAALTGILTNDQLLSLHSDGNAIIVPFDESHLKPTSYDVAVSQILTDNLIHDFEFVSLKPLEFLCFVTKEQIECPLDIVGHISLRSTFAREGLLGDRGRIEAGFRGRLVIEVFNASQATITIHRGDRIATLQFTKLPKAVTVGYSGQYQSFGI